MQGLSWEGRHRECLLSAGEVWSMLACSLGTRSAVEDPGSSNNLGGASSRAMSHLSYCFLGLLCFGNNLLAYGWI